jgi:hypothetical protein
MRQLIIFVVALAALGFGLLVCIIMGAAVGHFTHPIAGMVVILVLPFISLKAALRFWAPSKKEIKPC